MSEHYGKAVTGTGLTPAQIQKQKLNQPKVKATIANLKARGLDPKRALSGLAEYYEAPAAAPSKTRKAILIVILILAIISLLFGCYCLYKDHKESKSSSSSKSFKSGVVVIPSVTCRWLAGIFLFKKSLFL